MMRRYGAYVVVMRPKSTQLWYDAEPGETVAVGVTRPI